MNVLISKGTNTTGLTHPGQVPESEIAIFNVATRAQVTSDITALAANTELQIFQGVAAGKAPISTGIFKAGDIVITSKDYVAGSPQVSFVGFNGSDTSKDFPEVANGIYAIKLEDLTQGWEPYPRITFDYVAPATANQFTIANELAAQINRNEEKINAELINKYFVWAEPFVNKASTQLTDDGDTNVTSAVTQGSKDVIVTVSAGDTLVGSLAAGNLIRFGSATAVTSPAYIVAAVGPNNGNDTVTVTLTAPYGGASATGVTTGSASAPAASDAAGIKLTGRLNKTSFATQVIEDLTGAPITASATPNRGSGTAEQVAEIELRSFSTRSYNETNYFSQTPASYVVAGKGYDLITIKVPNDNDRHVLRENINRDLVIAVQEDGANAATIKGYFGV